MNFTISRAILADIYPPRSEKGTTAFHLVEPPSGNARFPVHSLVTAAPGMDPGFGPSDIGSVVSVTGTVNTTKSKTEQTTTGQPVRRTYFNAQDWRFLEGPPDQTHPLNTETAPTPPAPRTRRPKKAAPKAAPPEQPTKPHWTAAAALSRLKAHAATIK